jgi:hypothetical protein
MQSALRVGTTVLPGHRLEVSSPELPEGANVEVIVLLSEELSQPVPGAERERARAAAIAQFLTIARSSSFRSAGPYPTRDELHERH